MYNDFDYFSQEEKDIIVKQLKKIIKLKNVKRVGFTCYGDIYQFTGVVSDYYDTSMIIYDPDNEYSKHDLYNLLFNNLLHIIKIDDYYDILEA